MALRQEFSTGGHGTLSRGPQVQDLSAVINHFRPAVATMTEIPTKISSLTRGPLMESL